MSDFAKNPRRGLIAQISPLEIEFESCTENGPRDREAGGDLALQMDFGGRYCLTQSMVYRPPFGERISAVWGGVYVRWPDRSSAPSRITMLHRSIRWLNAWRNRH